MEYTISLPDCPSAIAYRSDGPFLSPFGKPRVGTSIDPRFPTGLSPCHHAQGSEGSSSTCPHRQTCYQALSEWYIRRGQYQRPDVTVSDRLDIAQRFHASDRPWGEVTGMAREYSLSRPTIYDIAERVAVLFEPHLPGPVPCLKRMLPCGATFSQTAAEIKAPSREEEERMRGRLILTSVFPGGVTMRLLEEILVEPISLAICGLHVPADGDRSSYTWDPLLLILQEDQHLDIYGGVGDAATPYPGRFQAILEGDDRFQEDIFHQLQDLQALRRKLENRTYRAFAVEYKAADQWQKKDTAEARQKLHQAKAESLRWAASHDDFAEYCSWVADAFEIVDLRSGEIRDRETNEWLLNGAIAGMSQLDHPEVVKMSQRLDRHKDRLLTYLHWLEAQLSPLRAELHAYLDEPKLEKVVLRAVARRWRLQHEVESIQRRAFCPSLKRAEQELVIWIEGGVFLEPWSDKVHTLLEWVQRASSASENIHSIFKPLVTRKKHFDETDTNLNFRSLCSLAQHAGLQRRETGRLQPLRYLGH